MKLSFSLNGQEVVVEGVAGQASLLQVLREHLGLKGTKEGCGVGECGACTVLVDGRAVDSCLYPAGKVQGRQVTTVEGLAQDGTLHPLQESFVEAGAVQCGFCTPGMLMSSHALLQKTPRPTEPQIKEALEGNLCRCTGYQDILSAVKLAAGKLEEGA